MRLFVFCLLSLLVRTSSAQEVKRDSSLQFALKTAVTKLDFFVGPELAYYKNRLVFFGSTELGINRTFFQQRVFPRASIGFGYRFGKDKLALEPLVMISQSALRLSRKHNSMHTWMEFYLGYRFSCGDYWKLVNEIMAGWMTERFRVQSSNTFQTVGTLGYYGSIGVVRIIR